VSNKRQPLEIKAWMVRNGITQTSIAREMGVSQALVTRTVHGVINNRRVLKQLLQIGVPERFLALPHDMQSEEAA